MSTICTANSWSRCFPGKTARPLSAVIQSFLVLSRSVRFSEAALADLMEMQYSLAQGRNSLSDS